MDKEKDATIPNFRRVNDSTSRITNLSKIKPLISKLDTRELISLSVKLSLETKRYYSLLIPMLEQIDIEFDKNRTEILQRWEENIWLAEEKIRCLELRNEILTELGINNILRKTTAEWLNNYLCEVVEILNFCEEEVKIRLKEENKNRRKNIQRFKKRKIRIVIAIIATSVGLLILSKSEEITRLIKLSWEKIHQILSPQE